MNTLHKIVAIVGIGILAAAFTFSNIGSQPVEASVIQSGEYRATTTAEMTGAVTPLAARTQTVILSNYTTSSSTVTLGSIVIASSTNATFKVWNATSTTDTASSTVAQFAASAANGTYTFDVILTRGLIIEMPAGFLGSYTITYR